MKDYYEILEVSRNASENTIKKVFRLLIKNNHPDLYTGDEKIKAEKRVKDLNEAYEVLGNKEKRKEYDNELAKKNVSTELTIKNLREENEYLKAVIQEKNEMIKEYLEEMGVNTKNFSYNIENEYVDSQNIIGKNDIKQNAFSMYELKLKFKNLIYIIIMAFSCMLILQLGTGINIFKIFVDVLKNMF